MSSPAEVVVRRPQAPGWPHRLRLRGIEVASLAVRGRLPHDDTPAVAIVGQRRATSHGREVAAWLADAVARIGVVVVSGGAVGVDAAAHRAAVDAGGTTVVVLGCGMDVAYPRVHARPGGLFDDVVDAGGAVVSQFEPGDEPRAPRVLARNRLVAGLADAVVVVEGRARSGALNTASHAADLGVPVLAVPGDVRAPGSAAPNRLLAEGCAPCRDPQDLLAAIGAGLESLRGPVGGVRHAGASSGGASGAARASALPDAVFATLALSYPRPLALDELAASSGVPPGTLLALLTRARITGEVTDEARGVRLRRAPR